MKQTLTLEIPDKVLQTLNREAARVGKSLETVALECITQHVQQPRRGSVEALSPFFGAWSMSAEERAKIERAIDEERHLEECRD